MTSTSTTNIVTVEDPPLAHALFSTTQYAWLWLILRVWIGYVWLTEGIAKLTNPAWTGEHAGAAIASFATNALGKTTGPHPDVTGWYAAFLANAVIPHAAFWSYAITLGELFVGIGLILGIFTGIAAFCAVLMNYNYLLAGSVSINPLLLPPALLLILAWKVAGWYGVDRYLLPALGTPWQPASPMPKVPREAIDAAR